MATGVFTDVAPGDDRADHIEDLASLGIVGGYPDGTYRPGASLTRGQVATILSRHLGEHATSGQSFLNVPVGSTHHAGIERLASPDRQWVRRRHLPAEPAGLALQVGRDPAPRRPPAAGAVKVLDAAAPWPRARGLLQVERPQPTEQT